MNIKYFRTFDILLFAALYKDYADEDIPDADPEPNPEPSVPPSRASPEPPLDDLARQRSVRAESIVPTTNTLTRRSRKPCTPKEPGDAVPRQQSTGQQLELARLSGIRTRVLVRRTRVLRRMGPRQSAYGQQGDGRSEVSFSFCAALSHRTSGMLFWPLFLVHVEIWDVFALRVSLQLLTSQRNVSSLYAIYVGLCDANPVSSSRFLATGIQ